MVGYFIYFNSYINIIVYYNSSVKFTFLLSSFLPKVGMGVGSMVDS
jgi:hypothetical protein